LFAFSGCLKRYPNQSASRLKPFLSKPTLVHFKHKAHGLRGAVGISSLWLHICQIDNGSVIRHKSGGEGEQGVFHPKALGAGLLKHKQHALVRRHFAAKHQANAALLRCLRNLGVDLVHTQLQFDAGKLGLRLVLGAGQSAPKQENYCRKNAFHGCTVKQTLRTALKVRPR
jgi:hypothetical protein